MPSHTYRHSDLPPLTGGIRALDSIEGLPCIEIRHAGEAFTLLASARDVPSPLRSYYSKLGKMLTDAVTSLRSNLNSAVSEGWNLAGRINSTLGNLKLPEEELERLHHVNNRLLKLEKSLTQKIDGMRERLEGFDPPGVEWDEWDSTDVILWLEIGADPERPAYDPDTWAEDGKMEPMEICARISQRWRRDAEEKKPWGLDDGQNHSDFHWVEGHPMNHFNQCYLFHELYSHADVGLWGMLHLRSIWIEIIPHRSGDFTI